MEYTPVEQKQDKKHENDPMETTEPPPQTFDASFSNLCSFFRFGGKLVILFVPLKLFFPNFTIFLNVGTMQISANQGSDSRFAKEINFERDETKLKS